MHVFVHSSNSTSHGHGVDKPATSTTFWGPHCFPTDRMPDVQFGDESAPRILHVAGTMEPVKPLNSLQKTCGPYHIFNITHK